MAKMLATRYDDLYDILKGSKNNTRVVGNNTRARMDGDTIVITLHATDIVRLKPDGNHEFTIGGFPYLTTRTRINEFIGRNRVHQVDYVQCFEGIPLNNFNWYSLEDFDAV